MAGILANSATQTMTGGDTAADKSVSGYVNSEQVVLSTTPTGTAYAWALGKPSGATARSDLTASTGASVSFTPDVAGYYVVTCTVDSTTVYVIRISVLDVSVTTTRQGIRMTPVAGATIPTPALGETLYWDDDVDRIRLKNSAGTKRDIDPAARSGTFTLSGGAVSVADTSVTATTVVAMHCETASNRGDLTITLNAATGFDVSSTDGSDASTWRYALIG